MYMKGQNSIPSDTVCYPGQADARSHRKSCLTKGVDAIFYPCMTYNHATRAAPSNCYNCPVVAYYPEVMLKANMQQLHGL